MHRCPQNHESETADFCSVCGVEIVAGAAPAPVSAAVGRTSSATLCPHCETPRATPTQVFCEVCGYNFQTGTSGVPTAPPPTPAASPPALAAPAAPPSVKAEPRERWEVVVTVDGALYGKPNPDAPMHQPTQTFTLFEVENLIGRSGTDIRAHIPIHKDIGVSRRHALLVRRPDGSLIVRDMGSANGTQLNGVELMAGVDNPVKDGDTIAIGAWTRITLRAVPAPKTPV
jgi:hypothetical protein